MMRYPPSGLSIIIVGSGIAGLGFAIEAHRKGHDVCVVERRDSFEELGNDPILLFRIQNSNGLAGDLIVLQSSALHTPKEWPGFIERMSRHRYDSLNYFKKFDGTLIGAHHPGSEDAPSTYINRAKFHALLEEYVRHLGIKITYSANVVEYFETAAAAGIRLGNGQTQTADIIVAADGVGTKAWGLLHGSKAEPINSGFAVSRVTFPAEHALKNPIIAKEFEGFKHRVSIHVGPDSHMVVGKTENEICWLLNHPVRMQSSPSIHAQV